MAKFITVHLARIESSVRINIDNIVAYAPRSQGAGVMTTIADGDSEYITRETPEEIDALIAAAQKDSHRNSSEL